MGNLDISVILILVLVGGAAAMLAIVRFKFAMLVFTGMVMASALAPPVDWQGHPVPTWIMPIQIHRSEIFAMAAALLYVTILFHLPRVKFSRIPLQGIFLLVVALYAALVRMIASSDAMSGMQSMAFAIVTILPGIMLIPSLFEDDDDALMMLRLLALTSVAWAGACAVQFVIHRKVLTLGGGYTRFQGMLGNPQHAGAYLAVMAAICLFLILNDTKYRMRPLWIAMVAVNVLLLLWTGSRTSVSMLILASSAVLYTRVGSAIILLPIAAGLFGIGYTFLESDLGEVLGRYSGGENTRSRAWAQLFDQFQQNPILGAGAPEDVISSENSVLFGLAAYGVFMGIILVLFIFASMIIMARLYLLRRRMSPLRKRLADLIIGFNMMYFAGAMFEGYMLSRVSTGLVFMTFFSALGAWLAQEAKLRPAEDDEDEVPIDEDFLEYADYGSDTGSRLSPAHH